MATDSKSTRELLVESARKLFSQRGFDGVSVKDIAESAGVNISLVSYHFDGKLGLYRECISNLGRSRLERAEILFSPPRSAEEFRVRLQMFIEEFIHQTTEDADLVKIILRELEQSAPRIDDIFEATFLRACKKFIDFLVHAQKSGFARSDLDALVVASMIYGTVFHAVQMGGMSERFFKVSLKSVEQRKKIANQIFDVLLNGFLKPQPKEGK